MANTANGQLTTDFNVFPYYDDYNEDKKYYRILYKPGYAVQARELTQMQTMLQKQIDRFGKHIFREGSIVLPGKFNIEKDVPYVKVRDVNDANVTIDITDYKKSVVTSDNSGVQAFIEDVVDGTETSANSKTIFVSYRSSGTSNADIVTFQTGDTLTTNVGKLLVVNSVPSGANTATGKGTRFVIEQGVLFAKEHFIYFPTSSIVLSPYSQAFSGIVGFTITEKIVSASQDSSLLDPALESSNYSAPGADRLQLDISLQSYGLEEIIDNPDFIQLFSIRDGIVTEIYDRPVYNILRDEMAKQKYDESGDYYVHGLGVRIRENLNIANNGGLLTTGNNELLSVGVEPGIGYVKGYEVNKLVTEYVSLEKGLTHTTVNTQISSASMGSYITLNEFIGSLDHDKGELVALYDKSEKRLTNKLFTGAPTGNSIGTARMLAYEYNSGVLGTPAGAVDFYITDLRMNGTNSFANVRSVYAPTTGLGGDIVLNIDETSTILRDSTTSTLLYPVGSYAVKNLNDTTFNFKRTSAVSPITTSGTVTLTLGTSGIGETLPYGTDSDISDGDKREIIFTVDTNVNIAGPGTVAISSGSNILNGSGTQFLKYNLGDKIEIQGIANTYYISSIVNDLSLTLTENVVSSSISGNTYSKVYKAGDIIDLTTKGNTGIKRVVSTTSTQLSFDLKEIYPTSLSGKVTYQVVRPNGAEVTKNLSQERYVKINCSTAGTVGPFNLGFADVYRIRKIIRKSGSYPTSLSDGTDVTSQFIFDNGQRDMYYEHGSIKPNLSLSPTDRLLIQLDYFIPTFGGFGYFSVESYPVDDDNSPAARTIRTENIPVYRSPTTGTSYDLRNYIDFRQVKSSSAYDPGASTTMVIADATENPAVSSTFISDTNGFRLPVPSSQLSYDFSYYLPRRDVVVIDKNGIISVVKGVPSSSPISPDIPANSMSLANLFIAPYPSLAPNYGQAIRRRDLSCNAIKTSNIRFTMRDINVLKERIVNLEYYASLNLLEKAVTDLKIRDENGLERFKSGIFVDTFSDHNNGDITNLEYKIVVDPKELSIRPQYTMHSIDYDLVANTNVVKTGDLITLPYTHTVLIDQPRVTTFRNIELSTYRFIGNLYLYPDTDVWSDTETTPDEVIFAGPSPNSVKQGTTTTWNAWQTTIVGQTYEKSTGGGSNAGTGNPNDPKSWGKPTAFTGKPTQFVTNPASGNGIVSSLTTVSDRDYRITELSKTTRTGVETTTSLSEKSELIGSKLIDVSLKPYVRARTIQVNGKGLKANTKYFVFFDGENMSNTGITSLIRPLTQSEFTSEAANVENTIIKSYTYNLGSDLKSSASGDVFFNMTIPPGIFRMGSREVIVTDSPTNAVDASSYAKKEYVAAGLSETKQNSILTTRSVSVTTKPLTETVDQTKVYYVNNISCSGYSFIPKAPAGEEGVFLTKLDMWFAAKHPTLGVWVEIREMDNAGGVTRNQVPFSEVWLTPSEMNVASATDVKNGTNGTTITFPAPVFLYNDTQYAFIIHTVGLNPDTYFWVSRVGETDVRTGQKVNARPLTGTFYTTNNNLNWDMVPDIDLFIKFYRAQFTTGVTGQVVLGNKPIERATLGNLSSAIVKNGERFVGNDRLTLTGNTTNRGDGNALVIGDRLIGQNSGANAAIISISGSVYAVANNLYIQGERLSLANANGTFYANTSVATLKRTGQATLSDFKTYEGLNNAEFIKSSGNFYVGDTIRGITSGITATIDGIANQRYSLIDVEPSYIKFNKTDVAFEVRTTANNTGTLDGYVSINDGQNYEFENEKVILSRSYEKDRLGGSRSANLRISMATTTNYLSPVIDLAKTHSVIVDNLINANTKAEGAVNKLTLSLTTAANGTINVSDRLIGSNSGANLIVEAVDGSNYIMSANGFYNNELVIAYNSDMSSKNTGNTVSATVTNLFNVRSVDSGKLINKYISQPIILAEGQDAEDIRVIITAYRPSPTDIKIWFKPRHSEDPDTFDVLPWIELEKSDDTVYSSLVNKNDFKEFNYGIPTRYLTGNNYLQSGSSLGVFQYRNTNNTQFTGYRSYQIKIGLLGGPENTTDPINSAVIPRVADLRVIALQI
jgi:hypothetical protein